MYYIDKRSDHAQPASCVIRALWLQAFHQAITTHSVLTGAAPMILQQQRVRAALADDKIYAAYAATAAAHSHVGDTEKSNDSGVHANTPTDDAAAWQAYYAAYNQWQQQAASADGNGAAVYDEAAYAAYAQQWYAWQASVQQQAGAAAEAAVVDSRSATPAAAAAADVDLAATVPAQDAVKLAVAPDAGRAVIGVAVPSDPVGSVSAAPVTEPAVAASAQSASSSSAPAAVVPHAPTATAAPGAVAPLPPAKPAARKFDVSAMFA